MTTIAERVEALEREMSGVKSLLQQVKPAKDWRKTFGMSRDDPGFEEMIRLGRELRENERKQEN